MCSYPSQATTFMMLNVSLSVNGFGWQIGQLWVVKVLKRMVLWNSRLGDEDVRMAVYFRNTLKQDFNQNNRAIHSVGRLDLISLFTWRPIYN